MKNKTSNTFQMFCPKCGKEYTVDAFDPNPVCEHDGTGLDFVPREKQHKAKGENCK